MNLPALPDRHTIVPAQYVRERAGLLSFFSSQEREGQWEVPRQLRVLCVLGSVELDLREARIAEGETIIEVVCVLGSVEVLVPPTVEVELDVATLGGSATYSPDPTTFPPRGSPRIVIRGSAHLGSVEVESRFAGEGKRDATRRVKAARRRALGSG